MSRASERRGRSRSDLSASFPLPRIEVSRRYAHLVESLRSADLGGLVVTSMTNIRYLSGFSGSTAIMVCPSSPEDGGLLITDGRYKTQAEQELREHGSGADIFVGSVTEQREALSKKVSGMSTVGLEAAHINWARAEEWKQLFSGVETVPTTNLVEDLRRKKDPSEIARIAHAAEIADSALTEVLSVLKPNMTELQVALEIDFAMRELGANRSSFDTIVASGPNGALPHAQPSNREIRSGELVVMDFGAVVDGYCSDMTRTVCLGHPQTEELERMVAVVMASQQAGVDTVRAGRSTKEVDQACRAVIEEAGWGSYFVHATGHGVGLDIHESPGIGPTSDELLEEEWVVTVEPGVYLPGIGGVRIEDTVVVTKDGCTPLTKSKKDLIV